MEWMNSYRRVPCPGCRRILLVPREGSMDAFQCPECETSLSDARVTEAKPAPIRVFANSTGELVECDYAPFFYDYKLGTIRLGCDI